MFSSFQGQHTRGDIGDSYLLILRYRNREIAQNAKSCSKYEKLPKSCRATTTTTKTGKLYLHDNNYVVTVLQ